MQVKRAMPPTSGTRPGWRFLDDGVSFSPAFNAIGASAQIAVSVAENDEITYIPIPKAFLMQRVSKLDACLCRIIGWVHGVFSLNGGSLARSFGVAICHVTFALSHPELDVGEDRVNYRQAFWQ